MHLVTTELDGGPIVLQRAVPGARDDTADTLAARILVEEHHAYLEAVRILLEEAGRLTAGASSGVRGVGEVSGARPPAGS